MAKAAYWTVTDVEARKRWGANRIRYPGSPQSGQTMNARCRGAKLFGAAANALSIPPGEYVRKNETQRN